MLKAATNVKATRLIQGVTPCTLMAGDCTIYLDGLWISYSLTTLGNYSFCISATIDYV